MIKKSFCHLCIAECGINVIIDNQKIIKIVSNFDDPVSKGYICEKAQKLIGHQYSSDRITSPMKKVNGKFEVISWDQALAEISAKLSEIISQSRQDRIFYMSSNWLLFDFNNEYSRELADTLGIRYYTDVTSVERIYPTMVNGQFYNEAINPDEENCQTFLLLGKNPYVTNHFFRAKKILNEIKNDPNRYLIVVDPICTETAKKADIHVKLNFGTDAWFLSLLIKVLIENNWVDKNYINHSLSNYDKISKHFLNIDTKEYVDICGVDYSQILKVASMIRNHSPTAIDSGNGLCHGVYPHHTSYYLVLISQITGNYQKNGAMKHNFSFTVPGYFDKNKTPLTNQTQYNGVTSYAILSENIYQSDENKFDAMIIQGCNPAERMPNSSLFKENVSKLGLVVVIDSFWSATAELGDYILPTPTFFERYEVFNGIINFKYGYIQLSRPVIPAPEFAKTGEEIFEELMYRVGIYNKGNSYIQKYNESPVNFLTSLYEDYTTEKIKYPMFILRKTLGASYENPIIANIWWHLLIFNVRYKKNLTLKECVQTALLQIKELVDTSMLNVVGDLDVATTSKLTNFDKINLVPRYYQALLKLDKSQLTSTAHEFILVGRRVKTSVNSIIQETNELGLEINNYDARRLMIDDNDIVVVETKSGQLTLKCNIDKTLPQGVACLPNGKEINKITNSSPTDYLNPQYKYVFANIRKLN